MPKSAVHDVYRKSIFIANELRKKIVDGDYAPGERLPSRDDLVAHYAVGKATVQRAFEQLKRDGFAVAKVGSGTIVSTTSPHLTRYAMLFPQGSESTGHNQLWYTMEQEARGLVDACNVDLHYGFGGHGGIDRYQGLLEDVKRRRLAGIIFACPPFALAGTPLLTDPDIARAAFMAPSPTSTIPSVGLNRGQFLDLVAAQVLADGSQRVALIAADQMSPAMVERDLQALARHGIHIRPDWVHGVSNIQSAWGSTLTRLLMAGPAESRPDCLIVLDDNLLPPISEALQAMSLIPPRDLQLIAHCNFPWPTQSAVPAVRIGFCITECLQALVQLINRQQQGLAVPPATTLPAYHQADYPRPIKHAADAARGR